MHYWHVFLSTEPNHTLNPVCVHVCSPGKLLAVFKHWAAAGDKEAQAGLVLHLVRSHKPDTLVENRIALRRGNLQNIQMSVRIKEVPVGLWIIFKHQRVISALWLQRTSLCVYINSTQWCSFMWLVFLFCGMKPTQVAYAKLSCGNSVA